MLQSFTRNRGKGQVATQNAYGWSRPTAGQQNLLFQSTTSSASGCSRVAQLERGCDTARCGMAPQQKCYIEASFVGTALQAEQTEDRINKKSSSNVVACSTQPPSPPNKKIIPPIPKSVQPEHTNIPYSTQREHSSSHATPLIHRHMHSASEPAGASTHPQHANGSSTPLFIAAS